MRNLTITLLSLLAAMALCLTLQACGGRDAKPKQQTKTKAVVRQAEKAETKPQLLCIHIYRYDDFDVAQAKRMEQQLSQVYPSVVLEPEPIPLPKQEYLKSLNRYRARGLADDLMRYRKGGVALALTDEIIYAPNEKSKTFGIFGFSLIGYHVAVVSTIIPHNLKKQNDATMRKLMFHELGHAFGLSHCKDQHCFMVDAEHRNKFGQTPDFCSDCKKFLISNGWKL